MKRKRFTALKVTLTAMMLTAALTSGAGSAYAADLSQEGGSEPTVTITPSPEVTPELPWMLESRLSPPVRSLILASRYGVVAMQQEESGMSCFGGRVRQLPGAEARAVFCRKFQERGLPRNLGAVW